MNAGRNRLAVAIGSVAAVGLLLAAFVAVWLMSRGPQTGNANVQKNTPAATSNSDSTKYVQTGAPSMAPITDQPRISVRGTGTISARPDMATIQVGVQIQKDKLSDAQAEASGKMDAIMKQLKDAGIEDKDISTSQYNVEPIMNYRENQPPVVTGFRVTNILSVKVRDLTKAGKLMDDLISSGANTVYGISFGFSDPTALMRQAREQAVSDARAKAEQLATLSGVTLGTPLVIDDGGSNTPPVIMQSDAMLRSAEGMGGAVNTPISPGQQEVRVDVSIIYGIK